MAAAPSLVSKLAAEFLGTFLLIFTVGCNVLGGAKGFEGLSIGAVLMVAIYCLGGISGANFNPAVSLTLGMTKAMGGPGMDFKDVAMYCVAQISGGLFAANAYSMMYGKSVNVAPAEGFTLFTAGICEMLYTFMLCFVVLNVAVAKKNAEEKNQYYGLAIGFVIIAGAYGAGAISGGCFNPAVALSLDFSSAGSGFGNSIMYIAFECLGAALAAVAFTQVRPEDFGRETSNRQKLTSEFLGTFMLVLTVGLNVLGKSPAGALSIAAALTSMIYALGDVSGANFNPAVTCGIFFSGRDESMTAAQAGLYALSQIVGGMTAALTYSFIYRGKGTFPLGPQGTYSMGQSLVAEAVFTFLLSYVVLCVAVSTVTKASHMFGLAIGFCVIVGGFAIGGVSGGSLNPAVSCGIAVAGGTFAHAMRYSAVQLAAGATAAGVFKVTHDLGMESEEAKSLA